MGSYEGSHVCVKQQLVTTSGSSDYHWVNEYPEPLQFFPIQYKKLSYEDNQAKWQEGREQIARYLSDTHRSVNSCGDQRNVYGAVAVGKLVEV